MAQRSLHVVTEVYYRSMSCFATVSRQTVPACSAKVSHTKQRLLHHVVQVVYKECYKDWSQSMVPSHSTEHDTQPTEYLFSKQVAPYWTCGGTCCPRVPIPKISYLADLSMTNHITWWNPTVSTIPTLLKPQHRSSPQSNHISTDGRPSLTKDGKTCTTLMTACLSITNQVWTQILKYEASVQN
jgi:hypothetical protein